jgi:hypothetical protein
MTLNLEALADEVLKIRAEIRQEKAHPTREAYLGTFSPELRKAAKVGSYVSSEALEFELNTGEEF